MDAKFSKYRNVSYAQFGEDLIVSRLLREKTGFYVDIGAHHPIMYSTTALLHARGWRGINVDADPTAIEAFNEYRPNDINLHVGVGAAEAEMDFHLLGAGKINTFDPNLARQRADRGTHGVIKVKVRTLASILAEYMPPDTEIDYLNIDCEGLDDAVVERIVALRPDVVLAASSTRAQARLEQLGLRVLSFESDRHDQVRSTLQRLGQLFAAGAAADAAWRAIEVDIERAAAQVPARLKGRSVYFEADSTPYAAGEASFLGQTLQRLHLRNVAPAALGAFPKLSPEFIVRAQPDVILATRRHVQEMPGRPGWSSLKALRDRQVCGFDEPTYELLIRPGPRMGEAALAMARCLAALPPTP